MRESHLYDNCFVPWVRELKNGHAGLEKNIVTDPKKAEDMMKMERLIMVTVVDPASVVRHHLDDEQLMRFQLEVCISSPSLLSYFDFHSLAKGLDLIEGEDFEELRLTWK